MGRIAIIPNTKKEGTHVLAKELVECYPEQCFIAEEAADDDIQAALVLGGTGQCSAPLSALPVCRCLVLISAH